MADGAPQALVGWGCGGVVPTTGMENWERWARGVGTGMGTGHGTECGKGVMEAGDLLWGLGSGDQV